MISADMRYYSYFSLGDKDEYGQEILPTLPTGEIRMAIYITGEAVQDNVNYTDANYIGLTTGSITDECEIDYEGERLKVLYVYPKGRYKQVFLKRV